MKLTIKLFLFLFFLTLALAQQRRGMRSKRGESASPNIFESFIDNVVNKISRVGYSLMAIFGSAFAYYKFFKKSKDRKERINEYIGQWKQNMLMAGKEEFNKEKADKVIYDLNFTQTANFFLKSHNSVISFNIQLTVKEAVESQPNLYTFIMEGEDPQGKSEIEGYAAWKENRMQVLMVLTHAKHQKKEESPIYLFEGKELSGGQGIEGEWWIEGQKGTTGEYCGTFKFGF